MEKTPYSQLKAKHLQTINKLFYKSSNQTICTFIAKDALSAQRFGIAQSFALLSSDIDLFIEILNKWIEKGRPGEAPWFILRAILMKLASDKLSHANLLYVHYLKQGLIGPHSRHPPAGPTIGTFLELLLKSLELKSVVAFQALCEKYASLLSKDKDFIELVDKVGLSYLGIVKQRPLNMMDMMSKMMGM